jgi:hypothetical protein
MRVAGCGAPCEREVVGTVLYTGGTRATPSTNSVVRTNNTSIVLEHFVSARTVQYGTVPS